MVRTRTVISLCATTATLLLVAFFVATIRVDDHRPTPVSVPQTGHVSKLIYSAFAKDGTRLLTQSETGEVILWDARTGEQLRTLVPADRNSMVDCRVSPDGGLMFYGRRDRERRLLFVQPIDAGQPRFTIDLTDGPHGNMIRFSQDGRFLVLVGYQEEIGDVVRLYDVQSGRVVATQKMVETFSPEVKSLMKQFEGLKQYEFPYGAAEAIAWLLTLNAASPVETPLTTAAVTYVPSRGTEDRFSPNGQIYVSRNWHDTGSSDEEVSIWDARTARLLHSFYGPYSAPRHVEFSSDGRHFLTGTAKSVAELRSARTGEIVHSFDAGESLFRQAVFDHSGTRVITATESGVVSLWTTTGEKLASRQIGQPVSNIDIRGDDEAVAVALKEAGVRVLSLSDLKTLQTVRRAAETVAFGPGDDRLLLGRASGRSQSSVRPDSTVLLEAETGQRLATITRRPSREISLSPDTKLALTRPMFWERGTKRFSGQFDLVETSSGNQLASFEQDSFRFVYDFPPSIAAARDIKATQKTSSRGRGSIGMPFRGYVPQFRFKRDQRETIASVNGLSNSGLEWLNQITERVPTPPVLEGAQLVNKSQKGKYTTTVWNTGWITLRMAAEFEDGEVKNEYVVPGFIPTAATLNSDEKQVVVALRGEERKDRQRLIAFFDRGSGKLLESIDVTQNQLESSWDVDTITLSPDDRFIAVGFDYHNFCYDREKKSFTLIGNNNGGLPSRQVVLFSPDSRRALFFGRQRTLWDLETSTQLTVLGSYNGVRDPVFSPNGKTLYAWGEDGPRLWESATGRIIREFERQHMELRFSADGRRMVPLQYSQDEISLWDFDAGKPICPLTEGSARSLIDVIFTPDGKRAMVLQTVDKASVLTVRDAVTGELLSTHHDSEFSFYFRNSVPSRRSFFLGDGQQLVMAHPNGATVWDTLTGNPVFRLRADLERECLLVRTPDGADLLTVSPGGAAKLWSLETGTQLQQFEGIPADIDVAGKPVWFSEDGSRLVANHRRGQSAIVWDVATGKQLSVYDLLSDGHTLSIKR